MGLVGVVPAVCVQVNETLVDVVSVNFCAHVEFIFEVFFVLFFCEK